jgi:hypothetical protein
MTDETAHPSDAQSILELEGETFDAIRNKDREALLRILDDGFVYRSPGGPDVAKADFIEAATTLEFELVKVWGENLRVDVYDEAAVLTGVQHARVQVEDGREAVSSVAFTDIFIRRAGVWRMVLAFGVELGADQDGR